MTNTTLTAYEKTQIIADKSEVVFDMKRESIFNQFIYSSDIKFVDSKENLGVQIADILIYCINWGVTYKEKLKFTRSEMADFYDNQIALKIRPQILYNGLSNKTFKY